MLEAINSKFYLDGKELPIYSGAIHYFRIPSEYWEDRLLKLKLCGFNTVETYVSWNFHEPKPNQFDFEGMLDIVSFVKTAQKLGLYVIVRPGPYICAEWDFGGFPAWLLKDKNMKLRCMDESYLACVDRFFSKLIPMLLPLQHSKGGNIIAFQVENEYGSYGNDHDYIEFVEQLLYKYGVEELLFTSDGATNFMLSGGSREHLFKVANFGSGYRSGFKKLAEFQKDKPSMCGEFWCGWFDHWGEKHHTRLPMSVMNEFKGMLNADGNMNVYMFCGGTNFGFGAGSNFADNLLCPTVTSYDYNAPLTEWGDYTPLYFRMRESLYAKQGLELTKLPKPIPRQDVGVISLSQSTPIRENANNLASFHKSPSVESMEYYGQNYGLISYKTHIEGRYESMTLTLDGAHDLAYVYFNGKRISVYSRLNSKSDKHCVKLPAFDNGADLEIVVSHLGRINYGEIYDRKGLRGVKIGQQELFKWEVACFELDNLDKADYSLEGEYPKLFKGGFDAKPNEDCFVHTDNLGKGYIFVNGINLGRYMDMKPQSALYLPGVWLKEKDNEIVVLELEGVKSTNIVIDSNFDIG